ncbi:MAG: GTPase ObgE [Lachnospiraceae bacterium]|nr:GTPase ObgE [Lachnospiraceae bacterium]
MFCDRAKITVKSGKGGDGHVSFRREKYVPNGGPDGGDGGKGGDVIIMVDEGMNTLYNYRHVRKYKAQDGEPGGKRNRKGKSGEDIILKVPRGTVLKDAESGKVIIDMSGDNERVVLLKGGRGGTGNQHYATSTMQAPLYAKPGQEGIELEILMELKVIADVGLLGFPNVGKSTFLSRVSNARPEIANYHFTTLNPHLGVVDYEGIDGFVIADIPGLIEGASEGVGLGHDFLRHIERTRVMIHIVDAASTEGRDPVDDIKKINLELERYDENLYKKPQVIAANKLDCFSEEEGESITERLKKEFEPQGYKVFPISAVSGKGIKELLLYVKSLLDDMDDTPVVFEQEYVIKKESTGDEPYTVMYDPRYKVYRVEGPKIEKMLGYTNLEAEKGFLFFQKFMKENGIIDDLTELGIKDGDTVQIYGHAFEFYHETAQDESEEYPSYDFDESDESDDLYDHPEYEDL